LTTELVLLSALASLETLRQMAKVIYNRRFIPSKTLVIHSVFGTLRVARSICLTSSSHWM